MKKSLENKLRYVGESIKDAQIRMKLKRKKFGRTLLRVNAGRKKYETHIPKKMQK